MNIVEELTILLDKYKIRPDVKSFLSLMPTYMIMDFLDDIYKDYTSLDIDQFNSKYGCDVSEKKMEELEKEYKKIKGRYSISASSLRFDN